MSRCVSCGVGRGCMFVNPSVSAEVKWSNWGSWSSCSMSCGGGRTERQRTCTGGSGCSGDTIETRRCKSNTCPGGFCLVFLSVLCVAAEVQWSNWESWSSCSKSCGGGKSSRGRTCPGGVGCSGVMRAERLCNPNSCPGVFHVIWYMDVTS